MLVNPLVLNFIFKRIQNALLYLLFCGSNLRSFRQEFSPRKKSATFILSTACVVSDRPDWRGTVSPARPRARALAVSARKLREESPNKTITLEDAKSTL